METRGGTVARLNLLFLAGVLAVLGADAADEKSARPGVESPADDLPPGIRRVTWFGERADWSHDGKRILFVEKTFGDVFELELASGIIRAITHHYSHYGYTRALYLANDDILLSGPDPLDPKKPGDARTQCWLFVLDKTLTRPAFPLGTKCSEGPAVSRKRLHIAWTHVAAEYPDAMEKGSSRMQEADLSYQDGKPRLANQRVLLESKDLPFKCTMETQNFVPPDENRLTFSAYGYNGTDACIVDLRTKKVIDLTNSPDEYDEPEGVFPDGKFTLVECDKQNKKGSSHVDLWKLRLDGGGYVERLTYFSDFAGFKSSNPVVSDDGRFMAFQMARSKDAAGVGYGIFVYDFTVAKPSPRW